MPRRVGGSAERLATVDLGDHAGMSVWAWVLITAFAVAWFTFVYVALAKKRHREGDSMWARPFDKR